MFSRPLFAVALLVAVSVCAGQSLLAQRVGKEAGPVISQGLLEKFSDRVVLGQDDEVLGEAIKQVSKLTGEQMVSDAQQHALARRQTLSIATGAELDSYSVYRDLLRFPEENRGRAVSISGVSGSVSSDKPDVSDGASVVRLIPADATGGEIILLVPSQVELPEVGERLNALGVFTHLAYSRGEPEKAAPVVIVRQLEVESEASGIPLDASFWAEVKDRTLGVQLGEADLYYRLLRKVQTVNQSDLKEAATQQVQARQKEVPRYQDREVFPVFVDMFQNPASYRGKAVVMRGYAREVRKYPAGANAEGIETLYETWIYTEDSQSNPAVVVSTSISADLPIGDDLQIPAQAAGYFFKIYGYRARDTTRVAPMVLAQTVERRPEPHLKGPPVWIYLLSATVVLALLLWLVLSYRKERHRTHLAENSQPDFKDLP